jgi:cell division septum initiation protein DivIVA
MSNHYQRTLNNITETLQDLLDDLIKDIDRLTNENYDLVDTVRDLEVHAQREYDRGYDDGLKVEKANAK